MNLNYIFAKQSSEHLGKPVTITLSIGVHQAALYEAIDDESINRDCSFAQTITNGTSTFFADPSQSWWQLDGENNTPISPSVYNPQTGIFKLSPIPILIPIKDCAINTFVAGTTTIELSSASINELENDFEATETALKSAKTQHLALIDGGNSANLMSNINARWNRDSAALRRNLLSQSPNLSAESLLEAAKLGLLKKTTLMEILLANSSACRGNKFLNALRQDIPTPLSESDIQQLLQAPVARTKRFELEESININSSNRAEIGKQLINNYLSNSGENKAKLRYWWQRLGSRHALYSLAESYIGENESSRYEAVLRNLSRDLSYSDQYVKENQDYVELYGIKSKILKSGRSLRQLNPSEIESIRRIANNTRAEAAVQANNILCVAIGECKKLDVPRMSSNTVINRSVQNSSSNTSISLLKGNEVFTVYPNPASNNIHVDYNLPDKFNDAYISLVDFTGKEIMRQKVNAQQGQLIWQTEQLKIGFYIISIVADNHSVGQSKLSIQK